MNNIKAYKLDMNNDSSLSGILVDFCLNDLCGSHKYYLVNYDGNVNVKRINSIDNLVEYLDRNDFESTEISNQSISSLVSTMEYYLKNDNVDNSLCNVPGTAPLNDFDKTFLKEYRYKIRQGYAIRDKNINGILAGDVNIPNKVSYTGGDYHGKK